MNSILDKVIQEEFGAELDITSRLLLEQLLKNKFKNEIELINERTYELETCYRGECQVLRTSILKQIIGKEHKTPIIPQSNAFNSLKVEEVKEEDEVDTLINAIDLSEAPAPSKFRVLDVLDQSSPEERVDTNFIIDFSSHYKENKLYYSQMNELIAKYLKEPRSNYKAKLEKVLENKKEYYNPLKEWLNGCGPTKSFINHFNNGNIHSLLTNVQKTALNNEKIAIYAHRCKFYEFSKNTNCWTPYVWTQRKMRGLNSPVTKYLVQIWWNNYGRLSFQNWQKKTIAI